MKINKKILLVLTIFLFTISTAVYAATSTDFFTKANKYITSNCGDRRIDNQTSLNCYLFYKSGEHNSKIDSLTQENLQQSQKITKLQNDLDELKGLFGGSVLGIPSPSLSTCYSPSTNSFTLTMENLGDIGGWIGLDENRVIGGNHFINLGFFTPHEIKTKNIAYEVNDSQAQKWDGEKWVLAGWYSLHFNTPPNCS